jgi:hypothetical protein
MFGLAWFIVPGYLRFILTLISHCFESNAYPKKSDFHILSINIL